MAEFLFNIAERVLEKIAHHVVEEFCLALNVRSDLRKLQETMTSIKAGLLDAERKQQQNEWLRLCMQELRDIFYDVEDVVDEFECEALRKQVMNHPSISLKVRCLASFSVPFAFTVKMGHKIKTLNERLDKLAVEWKKFDLGEVGDSRSVLHRQSHSFVNPSNVIGRDVDKDNIVDLLMKPCNDGNIPVIPIVGMGGLGKTTLAQSVYNDERVTKVFKSRIWVCVSEEFDLARLLKEIIHSITKEKCDDSTVDTLQARMRSLLKDEKFLLVLDDVWNEDRVKWIELRDLLISLSDECSSQNKIIVTTRSLKVASIMSSTHLYELRGLSREDCLTLFTKWAFKDGDERRYPNLVKIGEEITEKCKGNPLAVRTLGSLLYSITDEREWILMRDNEIWRLEQSEHDILPVLKLSYNHLPSHLQQCLAFLSLYKKDHMYYSNDVIQLWLANGLLEYPKQNQEWEDVGSRYLNELWSRCFIQDVVYRGFYFTFKMHDLIHDLASEVSQKECKTVQTDQSISEKFRHLSFYGEQQLKLVPQILKKSKHVRTVIVQEGLEGPKMIDKSFISFCVSNFKYLRALDLRWSSLEALPNSIGTLKHLRFLDLTGCRQIRELPSSLYNLQHLLTLKMEDVRLPQLPDRMQSLISLRCLEISIEAKQLKEIRPGCWSCLQFLGLFGCNSLNCLFQGMQYLTSLRTLYIYSCDALVSLPRNLKFLTKLEHLQIYFCSEINLQMELEVGESDQDLHLNLKTLSIRGSRALKDLPRLLLQASASTLQSILIDRCWSFEVLPEWLQNLTSLQKLEISHCPKLSSLPEGMDRLTALTHLKIRGCRTLSERCQRDTGADWPKIAHVQEVDIL